MPYRAFMSLVHVPIRSLQTVSLLLLMCLVTACINQPKPMPTAEQQEPPAPPTESADAAKPAELVAPEKAPVVSEGAAVPLPPIGEPKPEPLTMQEEIPVVEASPVVVTAQRESYTADRAMSATKTDTPLQETPVSVQTIPRAVIDDQKTPRLRDALENISGVRTNQSLGGGSGFIIRGFFDTFRVYRNGLLATSPSFFQSDWDTANIERIEVLKGPASILYGRIEPGGLVNVVTKRPSENTAGALEQQFGSYNFYRTLWDVTGAVTADRSLSVRFSGGYQNSESFRDFAFTDRKVFNPSVTWRPTDSTTITVDVEISRYNYRPDLGIPVIGNRPASVPISRSFGDPNVPLGSQDKTHFGYQLDHVFNETWSVTNRFLASLLHEEDMTAIPTPALGEALQADGRTLNRNIFGQTWNTRVYTTNLDLKGKFTLGETQHKVLLGVDYTKSTTDYQTFGNFNDPNPALAIDIFNPTYGIDPTLFTAARTTSAIPGGDFGKFRNQWYGVYFQDHATLWKKLHLLAGGRYDWSEVATGFGANLNGAAATADTETRRDSRLSPRVGLLYDLTPWLAVYGNYVTSFGANNGITANSQPLPPQTGKQNEVGLKVDLFEHRLNATLAFYHLTKNNVLTPDLASNDPFAVIAVGEERSRGIEFDMVGRVTDALSVISSYAYTDTRVTKDNSGVEGNRFPGVPLHAGSLWLKYDFAEWTGPVKGLSIGFGPYVAGARHGDLQNTFTLPGYVRLDGFAAYRWTMGPTRVITQLTVRNLLNQEYYESADQFTNLNPRNGVYPGAPLTLYGSLRLEY